jgi:adenylate cyclase
VAPGAVVAGNLGAREHFEYTVIGALVNEAVRLCELAKPIPGRVVASSNTVEGATEPERARWTFGDAVTLRGLDARHCWPTPAESPVPRTQGHERP